MPTAAFNLASVRGTGGPGWARGRLPGGHRLRPRRGCAKAAFALALLRKEQGDLAGAAAAYQVAIDSGHADLAPGAAVGLGLLRQEQGDLAGTAAAYQVAIDSGHANLAPAAAAALGRLRSIDRGGKGSDNSKMGG